MLLRFTVKAVYVSSSTSVWICMNEWNRGSHRVAQWRISRKLGDRSWLCPSGRVASLMPHLLTCGWMNWIANTHWCLLRSLSILLKCPFDLAIFCWQNESECVNLISDDLYIWPLHIQYRLSSQLRMDVTCYLWVCVRSKEVCMSVLLVIMTSTRCLEAVSLCSPNCC